MNQKSEFMTEEIDKEVITIFKETNALLTGHFILRSGLRSGHFFQCAQVCQYMDKVTRLAELLISKLQNIPCYYLRTKINNQRIFIC